MYRLNYTKRQINFPLDTQFENLTIRSSYVYGSLLQKLGSWLGNKAHMPYTLSVITSKNELRHINNGYSY